MGKGRDTFEVKVSVHGEQRARRRQGLPKRAIKRMAEKALQFGLSQHEARGELARYLRGKFARGEQIVRAYGRNIFIFGHDGTFVTTYQMPRHLYRDTAR